MSVSEILTELEHLSPDELNVVQEKIDQLRPADCFEGSAEEIAFIEEGIKSSNEERLYTLDEVGEEMKKWRLGSK